MADDLTLVARLSANASEFVDAMGKAAKSAEGFANDAQKEFKQVAEKLDDIGRQAKDVGLKMGAMGAAIVAPLALAGREASQFGRGLADVASLGVRNVDELGDRLQDLREDFGLNTDATRELYNTISASVPAAAALGVLEASAKGARAGVGELGVALDAGTSLLNSYGKNTGTAAEIVAEMTAIQGRLATAVKHGKTTIDEIGASIGRLAPVAAQTGVSMDEMLAAIAALTSTGKPASEQIAGLNQVIIGILKPTADAASVAEELGLEFNATALESKGLAGFLMDARQAMVAAGYSAAQQSEAMAKLFGSSEAMNAAMALTSDQIAGKFNEAMADMTNATDNLNKAFHASVDNDPSVAYIRLSASVATLSQDVGKAVNESFSPLAEKLASIVQDVRAWVEENPKLAASLVTVTGGAGGLLIALGSIGFALGGIAQGIAAIVKLLGGLALVASAFASMSVAVSGLGAGMTLLGISTSALVLPIAAVVAALAFLLYSWQATGKAIWDGISFLYDTAVGIVAAFLNTLEMLLKTVGALFKTLWDVITLDFEGVIETWTGLAYEWYQLFAGWIETIAKKVKGVFTAAGDYTGGLIFKAYDAVFGEATDDRPNPNPNPPANIPALAAGGIVTRPTLAYVGEAGPEAVIPLERMGSVTTDNSNVTIQVYGGDPRATAEAVFEIIQRRKLT